MPRKPQQARSKATVTAIIEAASQLMAREGAKGLGTRRIAERAGIGVGSVYEYFSDREAIIDAVYQQFISEAVQAIKPMIPELVRIPLRDAIIDLLMRIHDLLQADDSRWLECVRLAPRLARHNPDEPLRQVLMGFLMQYVAHHPALMQRADLPVMSYIWINGGIFTVVRHLGEANPPMPFSKLVEGLADMVARSLGAEPVEQGR